MINHGVINETSSNINETPWHSQLFTLKNAKKNYRARRKKPLLIQHGNGKSTIYSVFFSSKTLVDV
jgi:hypothetical protein